MTPPLLHHALGHDLWAMDGRFADSKIGDLIRALEIPMRGVYRRPAHRDRTCYGLQSLATADVAWLLIQLECLGLNIDPTVLAAPVSQQIKSNSHLNDGELAVFWYRRQRQKNAPIVLVVDPRSIGEKTDEIRTSTNYRIELWRNPVGRPTMLGAFSPRYRKSHASADVWGNAA